MDNYEIQHGHEEEAQEPLGLFHCIAMDLAVTTTAWTSPSLRPCGKRSSVRTLR